MSLTYEFLKDLKFLDEQYSDGYFSYDEYLDRKGKLTNKYRLDIAKVKVSA